MPGEAVFVSRFCSDPLAGDGKVSLEALEGEGGGVAGGAVQHDLLIHVLRTMATSVRFVFLC